MIDYQEVLADLEAKRRVINARFDAAAEAIRQVLALQGIQPVLPGILTPKESRPAIRIPHEPYKGLGIVEAAKEHLATVPEPVPNVELAKALENGGFKHKSKNFPNTLNSVLRRRSMAFGDIKKEGRGWTLASPKRALRVRPGPDEDAGV
jgi:hypothetical protein